MFSQEINKLNTTSFKLNKIFNTRTSIKNINKDLLNNILDEFNSLHYKVYFLQNENQDKIILIINQLCTLISTEEHYLAGKHCQLIHNLISSQNIILTDSTLKLTLQWCIQCLIGSSNIEPVDVLIAIHTLLSYHITSPIVNNTADKLFDILIDNINKNNNLNDIYLFKIKCLNSLCPHLKESQLNLLGKLILNDLSTLHPCLHSLLLCLRTICQYQTNEWCNLHLGCLISTVLSYAKYDLPDYIFVKPKIIFPSPGFQLDISNVDQDTKIASSFKTRAKNKKKNKEKDKDSTDIVIVSPSPSATHSDSDYSDSEISRLRKVNATIRLSCFKLLSTILEKVNKKSVFGYISTLILGDAALPHCLIVETSAKCRVAILDCLIHIFHNSKPFLAMALYDARGGQSFISFGSLLTETIITMHEKVLRCLHKEQYSSVIMQLLKCIDTLAINSPYEKLKSNLNERLQDSIFPFLNHKDADIVVVALTCFSDLVPLCSFLILTELCQHIVAKLENGETVVPVIVECWQLLSVMSKQKVNIIIDNDLLWDNLKRFIHSFLTNQTAPPLVQLHTLMAIEHFSQNLNSVENGCEKVNDLWNQIMNNQYMITLQDKNDGMILTAICDCLATMKSNTYGTLSRSHQRTCVAILLGYSSHDESTVRAAAVRALAIYTEFEYQDDMFLCDVADILVKCAYDKVTLVRTKAAWSLGNLSDTLVTHNAGKDIDLLRLLEATVKCCEDLEKIRSNAVRPLGLFLKLITQDHVAEEKYRIVIGQGVKLLNKLTTTGGKNMKMKWNACYALGYLFSNKSIMNLQESKIWKRNSFTILNDLLIACDNFKVKIAICNALISFETRLEYEDMFLPSLKCIIQSFETDIYDIHIDNLISVLIKTLCHFILLLNENDIYDEELCCILSKYKNNVLSIIIKVSNEQLNLLKEKCIIYIKENFNNVATTNSVVVMLNHIFVSQNENML